MESFFLFTFYADELSHIVYQMYDFLPQYIKDALKHVNSVYVYEIRLRENKPVTVNYRGVYRYLGQCGITEHKEKALICRGEDIADCVYRAGQYSVYSVEEQIKQGFLTAAGGVRLGLAGEYVFDKGQPLALRNFNALCIRIPHEIFGCGEDIYRYCMSDKVYSTLIVSPPGLGKTTILRDLARIISEKTRVNILICDERGEISLGNFGESCDVVKFADKSTAFYAGIRAMRPDIMITDELSEADCAPLKKAVSSGIKVIASAHFSDIKQIGGHFLEIFDRFVVLNESKIGQIKGIYDKEGKEIMRVC